MFTQTRRATAVHSTKVIKNSFALKRKKNWSISLTLIQQPATDAGI